MKQDGYSNLALILLNPCQSCLDFFEEITE